MTFVEMQVKWSVTLTDRLGPEILTVLEIKGQVLHRVRLHVKVQDKNSSLHLARKYPRIFVRGHYLFREANSFPRAKLEENCDICPRTLSVPRSEQFSESEARGKL